MKKIVIFLALNVAIFTDLEAQTVGINSTGAAPTDTRAMLEVLRPYFSKIKIRTENYSADTSMLEFTNRKVSGTGSDMRMSMISQDGLFLTSASDFAGNTNDSLLAIRMNGNIGMGINNPAYKLHLNTPLSPNNFLSITNSTTGIAATDGLILGMVGNSARLANLETGELRLGTSNLTRLLIDPSGNTGIGNNIPAYKLDVGGDINMTGALRVNGAAGTAGQILTSNGTSAPSWTAAPLSNTKRFNVTIYESISTSSFGSLPLYADYNFGGADIVIGTNSVTINKAGLYHFDLFLLFLAGSTMTPSVTASLTGTVVRFLDEDAVVKQTAAGVYKDSWHYSFDLYIPAATVLGLSRRLSGVSFVGVIQGNFSGHLISE